MLELRVLGSLELVRDDGATVRSVLAQPKRTALLAYLAAGGRPGVFHRRDSLLATFWPERDGSHARNALNQSLHFLRQSLGTDAIRARGREEVGVDPDLLRCDAAAFRDALERGEPEQALELYRGDLLEGFHLSDALPFERWADRERSRLRGEAREAACELAVRAGSVSEARRWLERALQIVPTDEEVVRRLMELLDGAGDRAGALRVYDVLATRLERTLGVEPSPEVVSLAEVIRGRKTPHGDDRPGSGRPSSTRRGPGGGEAEDPSAAELALSAGDRAGIRDGEANGEDRGSTAVPRDPFPVGRLRPWAVGGAAVLALGLVLAVATGTPDPDGSGAPATPETPSLAVLPFQDLSPDSGNHHLADGLTEELTTSLVRMSEVRVISRTSVMRYRERQATVRDIARDLGVTHVVEGTIRRSGERLAITAQLISAREDEHLWARTYDRRLVDLIDVQREVARAIARELPVEISAETAERVRTDPTPDAQAYEFYLRGREYQTRHSGDPGENQRFAQRMFREALARDSGFARAWARLAATELGLYQWSANREDHRVDRAREAAERALAADPDGPWGHWALADVHYRGTRDLDATLRHLEAAEAAGLSTSAVLGRKAKVMRQRGHLEKAARLFERARSLDPLNEELIFPSWTVYLGLRRYDEAEEVLRRVLELAPDHKVARRYLSRLPLLRSGDAEAVGPPASREWETLWRRDAFEAALADRGFPPLPGNDGRVRARRGLVYLEMGDSAAARAAFDSARRMLIEEVRRDSFELALSWLGIARAGLGEDEEALEAARSAVEVAARVRYPVVPARRFQLALVQILVGEVEAAMATLEEYLANPGSRSLRNIATHPLVEPLRGHPDFRELERRFGDGGGPDRAAGS